MNYRAEVDGLRAVAVLPVVFYHAHFPFFQGGFIGVDVFFVISGYLITSIIVEEIAEKRFSIANFYERRARRILPALFLVMLFSTLTAPLFLNPMQLTDFGNSVLAVILFVSNLLFWQRSGYFGTVSETSPLLHTWSLAVEEQYYIFFPLFLMVIWRYARKHIWIVFALMIFWSLALAEWGWRNSAIANFYLLPTRAWELLTGSIIAMAFRKDWFFGISENLKNIISYASLVTLLASFSLFDKTTPHPSLVTVIPVLATAGIIATASNANLVGRFLSKNLLVTTGLLSYSLYLWHQPIFAFAKLSTPESNLASSLLILTFVSFVIAFFSWKYWETPFRSRKATSRKHVFQFSMVGAFFLSVAGVISSVYSESIFSHIYPEKFANYKIIEEATSNEYNNMVNSDCHIWAKEFTEPFLNKFGICSEKHGKAVFITGGSHGMDLYNSIARNSDYPFIASVSRGYCRAHKMLGGNPPHKCHYDDLLEFASKNPNKLSSIIYTQTPDRLFSTAFHKATSDDLSIESINEVVNYLDKLNMASGVRVCIVGMLPILRKSPKSLSLNEPISAQLSFLISDRNVNMANYVDSVFAEKAGEVSIPYISKVEAMNLVLERDLFIDGRIAYSDTRHLSTNGEKMLGKRLVDYLSQNDLLPLETEMFEK